jgi:hypothetical protein
MLKRRLTFRSSISSGGGARETAAAPAQASSSAEGMKDAAEASRGTKPPEPTAHEVLAKSRALQYVHLSIDCLLSDDVPKALQIMQIAENVGIGSNPIIQLQQWCILKLLRDDQAADAAMDAACVSVPSANRGRIVDSVQDEVFEGSNLPVFLAAMLCANHLQKKSKADPLITPAFENMLNFAARLKLGSQVVADPETAPAWFASGESWSEAGKQIMNTDFMLIAEQCFLEGFYRQPLRDDFLQSIQQIRDLIGRQSTMPELVWNAFQINPYSNFCRNYLRTIESPSEDIIQALKKINSEDQKVIRLQSLMRMLRHFKNFDRRRNELRRRNNKYRASLAKAKQLGLAADKRNKRSWLRRWVDALPYFRQEKQLAALKLTRFFRLVRDRYKYLKKLERHKTLHLKYIEACHINYDFVRSHYLHYWVSATTYKTMTDAAIIVRHCLQCHRRLKILKRHLKTTSRVGLLHNRVVVRHYLAQWVYRKRTKTQNRASAIIRLFVRRVLLRFKEKEKLALLANAEKQTKARWANLFLRTSNRVYFSKWKFAFLIHRKRQAVKIINERLAILFARKRDRALVSQLRINREKYIIIRMRHLYRIKSETYRRWRFLKGVYALQRAVRAKMSRMRFKMRKNLIERVDFMFRKYKFSRKKFYLYAWKQYTVQCLEEKRRAGLTILFWVHKLAVRFRARRLRKKQIAVSRIMKCLYTNMTRHALQTINRVLMAENKYRGLLKMFKWMKYRARRIVFEALKWNRDRYDFLHKLLHVTLHRRLGRKFFPGVNVSAFIAPVEVISPSILRDAPVVGLHLPRTSRSLYRYGPFDGRRGGKLPRLLARSELGCDCGLFDTMADWEHYIKPKRFGLASLDHYFSLKKTFDIWTAMFRVRIRHQRILAFKIAEGTSKHVIWRVSMRWASACTIQRATRSFLARAVKRRLFALKARHFELLRRYLNPMIVYKRVLYDLLSRSELQRKYRLRLQSWWRMKMQRDTLHQLRTVCNRYRRCEDAVRFKLRHMMMQGTFRSMVFMYSLRASQVVLKKEQGLEIRSSDVLFSRTEPERAKISTDETLAASGYRNENEEFAALFPNRNPKMRKANFSEKRMRINRDSLLASHTIEVVEETNTANINKSYLGSTKTVYDRKTAEIFNELLFQLKMSGTLVLDSYKVNINDDELVSLCGQADTVFCEVATEAGLKALRVALRHFLGSKLVVYGGVLDINTASDLCFFALDGVAGEERLQRVGRELRLHLNQATLPRAALKKLMIGMTLNMSVVSELSVDAASISGLGIAALLCSLRVRSYFQLTHANVCFLSYLCDVLYCLCLNADEYDLDATCGRFQRGAHLSGDELA